MYGPNKEAAACACDDDQAILKQTNKPISKLNFPPQNNKRNSNQKEEPKQESQTTHTMVT